MGLISFFRRLFSKDIVFRGDKRSHLVYVYNARGGRVWFEKNISVPKDFEFYFAKNGTVLDGFIVGEHEITPMYVSKTIKYLKLNKKRKKDKELDFFVADGYFISLLQAEPKSWKMFAKAELYDQKYGLYKVMLEGEYIAQITGAKQFLKRLLTVYDFLKQGEAESILEGFISESIYKILMKENPSFELLKNTETLTDMLFEKLAQNFERSGVEILGFSIKKVTFSKNLQQKLKQERQQEEKEKFLQQKIKQLEEIIPQSEELLHIPVKQNLQDDVEDSPRSLSVLHKEKLVEENAISNTQISSEVLKKIDNNNFFSTPVNGSDNLTKQKVENLKNKFAFQKFAQHEDAQSVSSTESNLQDKNASVQPEIVLVKGQSLKEHVIKTQVSSVQKQQKQATSLSDLGQDEKQVDLKVKELKCKVCGEVNFKADTNCVLCGEKL